MHPGRQTQEGVMAGSRHQPHFQAREGVFCVAVVYAPCASVACDSQLVLRNTSASGTTTGKHVSRGSPSM